MLDNEFDYEVYIDDEDDLVDLFKGIPEKNIAFAFTGRPYPFAVHVLRQKGRATVRELPHEVLKQSERCGDGTSSDTR